MKTLLITALAVGSLISAASAQVALRPGDVKIEKVSPQVVKTPEVNFSGGSQKRSTPGQWLEIEVEFQTVPEMIDELTFTYKALINNKLCVGEVSHVAIPKGREHYSVAYIAPRSLEQLMGGKQINSAAIAGIWVEVSHQGMKLSEGAQKPGPIPNVAQLQGLILNKSQTPFAPLYWDRYEALKPGAR